jgi:hypothetical protein
MSPSQSKPALGRPTPFANRVAGRRARAPAAGDDQRRRSADRAPPTYGPDPRISAWRSADPRHSDVVLAYSAWLPPAGHFEADARSEHLELLTGGLPTLTAVADVPEGRIVVYTPMDDETRERLPLTRRLTAG